MTEDENAGVVPASKTIEPSKPKAKAKPQRVTLTHPKMKGEARPFAKDKGAWLAVGWREKSAGNAD